MHAAVGPHRKAGACVTAHFACVPRCQAGQHAALLVHGCTLRRQRLVQSTAAVDDIMLQQATKPCQACCTPAVGHLSRWSGPTGQGLGAVAPINTAVTPSTDPFLSVKLGRMKTAATSAKRADQRHLLCDHLVPDASEPMSINDDIHAPYMMPDSDACQAAHRVVFGATGASETWAFAFAIACMHPSGGQPARAPCMSDGKARGSCFKWNGEHSIDTISDGAYRSVCCSGSRCLHLTSLYTHDSLTTAHNSSTACHLVMSAKCSEASAQPTSGRAAKLGEQAFGYMP